MPPCGACSLQGAFDEEQPLCHTPYVSEQTRDCRIVTIDRADFSVYRRHGREAIPVWLPD
jgi:hypothetical protein